VVVCRQWKERPPKVSIYQLFGNTVRLHTSSLIGYKRAFLSMCFSRLYPTSHSPSGMSTFTNSV
jgi:hypothetical protein